MEKGIIFDLDGTLLDTLDDLTAAVNFALRSFGLCAISRERVRKYVGNGVPKLIERATFFAENGIDPNTDSAKSDFYDPALTVFTQYYNAHNADLTKPYDGVADMLGSVCKKYATAIVTNKYDGAVQALKAKFFSAVDVAVGLRDGIRAKPAPDGVLAALEAVGCDSSNAIYVGDGETDIATARACGLPVIAVGWGFRDKNYLKTLKPDYIIDSPDELIGVLDKHFSNYT